VRRDAIMNEAEWLACDDPRPMLEFLRGKASERKMRLFLVACARLVWDQLSDLVMRTAVETAERYADGLASSEELRDTHDEAFGFGPRSSEVTRTMGVPSEVSGSLRCLSVCCGFSKKLLDKIDQTCSWDMCAKLTSQHQPLLLLDIFGNPFRLVPICPFRDPTMVMRPDRAGAA
jgi:hypothetical protein